MIPQIAMPEIKQHNKDLDVSIARPANLAHIKIYLQL